jgi:hypothetical protein
MKLEQLREVLAENIPPALVTRSPDGIPNVMNLSKLQVLDADHLVASCQFPNKTKRNLRQTPRACLLVTAVSRRAWRLDVVLEAEHTQGPLYERMADELAAIASWMGMESVFRLHSADVYRVLSISEVPHMVLE